ncbi:MAG: Hpt domain-containing protein [Lachnospiraceae bacterium]|nr:Hpt domain-containing protein [Lachnospiraceae bacterium]
MTERDKLEYLEKQGINVKAAMRFADDSMEFYEQLIDIYLKEYEPKRERLQATYQNPDDEYKVLVHGLKNSSRYLGADELADLFFEHEKAAKAGNVAYILKEFASLLEMWENVNQIFSNN